MWRKVRTIEEQEDGGGFVVKAKEQFGSILNLNPALTGNLITIRKDKELVYVTLLKS